MGGHHGGAMHGAGGPATDAMGHDAANAGGAPHRASIEAVVTATGYIALGLIALTLLVGPINLLLGRRVPVSNYLSRDVGTWAVIFSVIHTAAIGGLASVNDGGGLIASFTHFFVARDGRVLTNSFGVGNWAGLVALVIAVGLLGISNDTALRALKAKPWKRIQRLNYALFGLVVAHAIFYGVLSRPMSASTVVLDISVVAVVVGQAIGIRLWRRRDAIRATTSDDHALGAA
jgi:sulfoxide reductase heme-binding subunit YedZ